MRGLLLLALGEGVSVLSWTQCVAVMVTNITGHDNSMRPTPCPQQVLTGDLSLLSTQLCNSSHALPLSTFSLGRQVVIPQFLEIEVTDPKSCSSN